MPKLFPNRSNLGPNYTILERNWAQIRIKKIKGQFQIKAFLVKFKFKSALEKKRNVRVLKNYIFRNACTASSPLKINIWK